MKMSQLLGQTRKEVPAGVSARSHELLLRGAYIHQVAAGIFSYLPLGLRVMQKISTILRQELEAIGAQEVNMPIVQPADLWQQSGRWHKIGAELGRFVDRKGHNMALAMTHEEAAADLVRQFIHSYRDLPRLIYHIQSKWRDDPRPRAGLIRVREFVMKDSYSLDSDEAGLVRQYRNHYRAYLRIFDRCALPVMAVLSDTGMMGGSVAHEFMYASDVGEDTILFCPECGYSANRQVAKFRKLPPTPTTGATPNDVPEEIATPNCQTIAAVTDFLQIEASSCAKMVFFRAQFAAKNDSQENSHKLVAAVLPGNMELNETKLAALLGAKELQPAEETEIRAIGAVPGYASPVGLDGAAIVVADELIAQSAGSTGDTGNTGHSWVSGANKEGLHLRGLRYGRDFTAQYVGDLGAATAGHHCHKCAGVLKSTKAVEVGNIFQLGTFYSEAMGCYFNDENGKEQPVFMGSYGIGIGRLAACIAEQHHDAAGLIWPISVAPYHVHLISLGGKKETKIAARAQQLYDDLQAAKVETLFDDRAERPGCKFKDADLIGIPIHLTLGKRYLEKGGLEFNLRGTAAVGVAKDGAKIFWPLDEVVARVQAEIARLKDYALTPGAHDALTPR